MSETSATIRSRSFPESTYRVQLHAGFTFADTARIVPYFRDLGITHLYMSPILEARSGSMHGYDVVDHSRLNPELGTDADFDALVRTLHSHDMGLIVDIVPNHMGVGTNDNAWWNDVLEKGPASAYGEFFDIAWQGSPRSQLHNKVLLPILGAPFGKVLERGELKLVREDGRFQIAYFERRFPLSAASVEKFELLPELDLLSFNGKVGRPGSFDRLGALLDAQFYRLTDWRLAADEINYRRFFDINDLAAICMQKPGVFEASHRLVLKLIDEGKIYGLRIDHPDGLFDPAGYFEKLQAGRERLFVVVEKILAGNERLPEEWAVDGTSGYDFINRVNGLFVDSGAAPTFSRRYCEESGISESFEEICYQKKRQILFDSFASELEMLAGQLDGLAQHNRHWRDFSLASIRQTLAEVISCFPVYRTYITDQVSAADAGVVDTALRLAGERNPAIGAARWAFLRSILLLDYPEPFGEEDRATVRRFVGKFQQLTAPVMAKGMEDTAFYIYNRLISLNEVGGDPGQFGQSPEALHRWLLDRQRNWPFSLSPLSTHDTKRSEDVRARLNVLSEIPDEWWRRCARWTKLNEPFRRNIDGLTVPDANEQCHLYQTLLGAWPIAGTAPDVSEEFVRRIQDYMLKAMREANVHTSWTSPKNGHERAVSQFIRDVLSPEKSEVFLQDFVTFEQEIDQLGLLNSLSQTLVRLTAPGVADTYQGTELWDFSLVDPDNRRPVDYARRRKALEEMMRRFDHSPTLARELLSRRGDGHVKLFLTWRALTARREFPALFSSGQYLPLEVPGPRREHLFGFIRREGETSALIIVPRLLARLRSGAELLLGQETWKGTRIVLPPEAHDHRWRDELTGNGFNIGASVDVGALLADFPVALLILQGR